MFGSSVAIHNNVAIIGANNADSEAGRVYVFKKDSETGIWDEIITLLPTNGQSGDQFGYSVSVKNNLVIVGAPFNDEVDENAGVAFVFDLGNLHNITVNMENQDGNVSVGVYCESGETDGDSDEICGNNRERFVLTDSCVQVSVSVCNTNGNDRNNSYNFYTIHLDDTMVEIVDYYDSLNNHNICPMQNHISFCTYTSNFCVNSLNLVTVNEDNPIMKSYQSIVGAGFSSTNSNNVVQFECAASYSCLGANFTFNQNVILQCKGVFSCVESFFNSGNGDMNCYGFGSCDSITTTTDISLYVLSNFYNHK